MTSREPEFPRPSVGDMFVVRRRAVRGRDEEIIPVRVKAMARYRITLEGPEGEKLPWMYEEMDIRTRTPWDGLDRRPEYKLHTAETLAWEDRKCAADRYLRDAELRPWNLRGSLRKAVDADPIGFVNLLRRFEGLDEL